MKPLLLLIPIMLLSFSVDKEAIRIYKTNSAQSTMKILGTSTLHDWEMKADDLQGTVDAEMASESINIKELKLTVPVEALKSGKGPMDANAYKALKKDKHPKIFYELISVSEQKKVTMGHFKMQSRGKLTVAGKSRILNVPIDVKQKDHGLEISGVTSFNMSSFDVEAPSFMMGAVTTGDKIKIQFSINYN